MSQNKRQVIITEFNNGYQLQLVDQTRGGDYVYKSIEDLKLLEHIGKFLLDRRVKVTLV